MVRAMRPVSTKQNEKTPTAPLGAGRAAGLGVTPAERKESRVIELPTGGRVVLYWNGRGERGASFRGFVPHEVRELVIDELRHRAEPRVEILENEIKNAIKKVV